MVDNELAAAVEEIAQIYGTVRAIENVLLLNLDHRQLAALGAERVALTRGLLFLGEQLLARNNPISSRYDTRMIHLDLLWFGPFGQFSSCRYAVSWQAQPASRSKSRPLRSARPLRCTRDTWDAFFLSPAAPIWDGVR